MPAGTKLENWILLRGLTREARHWGAFPRQLDETLGNANITCLDTPGNGTLHQVPSPTRIEAMMEHCRAQLDSAGINPPYSLLSISLGSMIATAWADKHPDELARTVMLSASLRPFSPFYQRLRPANYGSLIKQLLLGNAESMEGMILRITSSLADPSVLDDWVRFRREHPVSVANSIRQLLAAARYRAPLTAPKVPTLLLAGQTDKLVDYRCSQAIAEAWQVPLYMHPTAGHDLPLDAPIWVIDQITHWIHYETTLPASMET